MRPDRKAWQTERLWTDGQRQNNTPRDLSAGDKNTYANEMICYDLKVHGYFYIWPFLNGTIQQLTLHENITLTIDTLPFLKYLT